MVFTWVIIVESFTVNCYYGITLMCSTGWSMDNSMSFPGTKNRSIFRADHPFTFVILSHFDYSHVIFIGKIVTL